MRVIPLTLLLVAAPALAQLEVPLPIGLDAKVETILAPLSGMPTIQRANETLGVELVAGAAADLAGVDAALTPSFGQVRPRIELGSPVSVTTSVPSRLWPGRDVDRLEYALPADLLPDLYDLEVSAPGVSLLGGLAGADQQRRAVSIAAEYPRRPRVVILSDTHTGDPRAVVDAAEDAVMRGEYAQFIEFVQRSVGNPADSKRWAAFARVVHEINLVRPDFVLVTGDLTFENHSTILPYEYEDAWRLLDRLEVPAFVAPGNHDLYSNDDIVGADLGLDGTQLWHAYFGPLHYAVDIGPALHLTALNTFEWPRLDPFPPEDEFDTRAAGQVTPEQFAWIVDDLRGFRERSRNGILVTFAHHDPSWNQRRHAWLGENRLELRDAFAAHGVAVHFSGHTHEDRVARYFQGGIVQTNGRPIDDQPVRELSHLLRDGSLDDTGAHSQEALGEILHDPRHGPLFVSTTTCASEIVGDIWGLGGYWGWRLALLEPDAGGGLDPASFGYPATDDFLARRAERPGNWTAAHAPFGLFSYPSFELDHSLTSASSMRVTSRLLADLDVHPRLSLAVAENTLVRARNGTVRQVRYGSGLADVWVDARVPANQQIDIAVEPGAATEATFGGGLSLSGMLVLLLGAFSRSRH
jgi:3',5'-cyclic AMP phosphodiesterase CpdA